MALIPPTGSSVLNITSGTGSGIVANNTINGTNLVSGLVAGTNVSLTPVSNFSGKGLRIDAVPGSSGVASVTAGNSYITIGGTSINPTVANNGVQTLTAGTGVSLSGSANQPVVNNTGVLGLTAGNAGITVGGTAANPTISNAGVLGVTASGAGIAVSGTAQNPNIQNTGVTSLVAGSNITLSGSTGAVTISASGGTSPITTVTFDTVGAGSYTVPGTSSDLYRCDYTVFGGGGGGSGGWAWTGATGGGAGGGGGGGDMITGSTMLVGGSVITFNVGAGGLKGFGAVSLPSSGVAGNPSTLTLPTLPTITANPGQGSIIGSYHSSAGGAGAYGGGGSGSGAFPPGTAGAGGVGTVLNGQAGTTGLVGGNGAGNSLAGTGDSVTQTGGGGSGGGIYGGAGGSGNGGAGANGGYGGGGGGGAGCNNIYTSPNDGGYGGVGAIILIFTAV